jgi:hypothetical protein
VSVDVASATRCPVLAHRLIRGTATVWSLL